MGGGATAAVNLIHETRLTVSGKRMLAIAACAMSLMLAGCGAVDMIKEVFVPRIPRVELGDINVFTDKDANLNTALELEIVLVQDPDALKKISELTAVKWFEQREDIRKNYPGGYESFKWELSPGQDVRLAADKLKDKRAYAVVVYANYLTPGEHRARIDNFQDGAIIRLLNRGFTVSARGGQAK